MLSWLPLGGDVPRLQGGGGGLQCLFGLRQFFPKPFDLGLVLLDLFLFNTQTVCGARGCKEMTRAMRT